MPRWLPELQGTDEAIVRRAPFLWRQRVFVSELTLSHQPNNWQLAPRFLTKAKASDPSLGELPKSGVTNINMIRASCWRWTGTQFSPTWTHPFFCDTSEFPLNSRWKPWKHGNAVHHQIPSRKDYFCLPQFPYQRSGWRWQCVRTLLSVVRLSAN